MSRMAWLLAGVGLGVAIARRVERSAHASTLEAAASGAVRVARRAVESVIADGRAEMHQREAQLRAVLAAPRRGERR